MAFNTGVQAAENTANSTTNLIGLFSSADLIGKGVIFILLLCSIWSWTIIIDKLIKLKKIALKQKKFEHKFWSGEALEKIYDQVKLNADNPLSFIFIAAMKEWQNHKKAASSNVSDIFVIGFKDRLLKTMDLSRNRELEKLEANTGFLATVGSAAPFIGLFGTVWGIMHSFQSIATAKNTSLAVVAPGIAEALLATAIGLVAAIPAVVFYNYIVSKINNLSNRIDDYCGELYNLLTRAADQEKQQ